MRKGRTTRKARQDATPQKVDIGDGEGEGASGGGGELPKCWRFVVSEPTPVISEVEVHDPIIGSKTSPDVILLHSQHGTFGFVPSKTAEKIDRHFVDGSELRGNIVEIAGAKVWVRLCMFGT